MFIHLFRTGSLQTTLYKNFVLEISYLPLEGVCVLVGCANLTAWCSGPRGCALTRDVLLLDAMQLCAGVPARFTVRRNGDEVWVEDG
ncbi:unnamed protein product [Prunus armeniaca]